MYFSSCKLNITGKTKRLIESKNKFGIMQYELLKVNHCVEKHEYINCFFQEKAIN